MSEGEASMAGASKGEASMAGASKGEASQGEASQAAFEVIDALGLCRLETRSPTLGGSVPLRVAQACAPLLEGNSFGHQVVLAEPLRLERPLGRPQIALGSDQKGRLGRALSQALPRLEAQGFLLRGGAWTRVLARGIGWAEGGLFGARLRLWTGLLVRPREGLWLRVSGAANRRSVRFSVASYFVASAEGFTPLVLDLVPSPSAPSSFDLAGEIGCLAPVRPGARVVEASLRERPEVGRAHASFYDAAYFAQKKGESTRKYRTTISHPRRSTREKTAEREIDEGALSGGAECALVVAGPKTHCLEEAGPFATPEGPELAARAPGGGSLSLVVHRNPVAFRAHFDGQTVAIEPDRAALSRAAAEIERLWGEALGPGFVEQNRGALWYLTKYFTPHPPGEPHFFVKPWSFFATPAGWSSVVDGEHGPGFDVMRGVVRTDAFFATPAVFWLREAGSIEVAEGAKLVTVLPLPRALLEAGYRARAFLDG